MKEFLLVFRTFNNPDFTPSPEQMQEGLTNWMNWMGGIAAQNKLVNSGSRLSISNAKTVKPNNVIVDGPYTEIKEFINGYIVVKAANIDEAVDFAIKNSAQVKNALIDIQIQRQTNKEITATALPQVNSNLSLNDYLSLPTSLVPAEFGGGVFLVEAGLLP